MSTIKNKTTKNGSKLNENKNAKQVITKTENIEICPQKSSQDACVEHNCAEEMSKNIVKDKILALRNRYASRTIISAEEFKSALAEIENAIK